MSENLPDGVTQGDIDRASEGEYRCPDCGAYSPEDDVLDEVDIGVGTLVNRCHNPFHEQGAKRAK